MAFVLLLSEDKTHLPDLYSFHDFMTTFFLARHDQELAALQKEHRPGPVSYTHLTLPTKA